MFVFVNYFACVVVVVVSFACVVEVVLSFTRVVVFFVLAQTSKNLKPTKNNKNLQNIQEPAKTNKHLQKTYKHTYICINSLKNVEQQKQTTKLNIPTDPSLLSP